MPEWLELYLVLKLILSYKRAQTTLKRNLQESLIFANKITSELRQSCHHEHNEGISGSLLL